MLKHLERSCHSVRRLRLAAYASCRLVWGLLSDRRCKRAVRFAEWQARARASPHEIAYALEGAKEAAEETDTRPASEATQAALRTLAGPPFADVARHVAWLAAWQRTLALPGPNHWEQDWADAQQAAEERLCAIIRRCFPSPSPLPPHPPWKQDTVLGLARTAAKGCFELLPILADAMEEAGCEIEEVLANLRLPGGHRDQCWLVQLILEEKEAPLRPSHAISPQGWILPFSASLAARVTFGAFCLPGSRGPGIIHVLS